MTKETKEVTGKSAYREAEAAEHAELWKDKAFRVAVKKHERKSQGTRQATGKR